MYMNSNAPRQLHRPMGRRRMPMRGTRLVVAVAAATLFAMTAPLVSGCASYCCNKSQTETRCAEPPKNLDKAKKKVLMDLIKSIQQKDEGLGKVLEYYAENKCRNGFGSTFFMPAELGVEKRTEIPISAEPGTTVLGREFENELFALANLLESLGVIDAGFGYRGPHHAPEEWFFFFEGIELKPDGYPPWYKNEIARFEIKQMIEEIKVKDPVVGETLRYFIFNKNLDWGFGFRIPERKETKEDLEDLVKALRKWGATVELGTQKNEPGMWFLGFGDLAKSAIPLGDAEEKPESGEAGVLEAEGLEEEAWKDQQSEGEKSWEAELERKALEEKAWDDEPEPESVKEEAKPEAEAETEPKRKEKKKKKKRKRPKRKKEKPLPDDNPF